MKVVIEPDHFNRTLKRMTHEIIERNEDLNRIILVGIERKGSPIAREIASLILQFEGVNVDVESIDISAHRDDNKKNILNKSSFSVSVDDKIIILVDDVLYTGRSVRAAMDAIMDMGRPAKIELAILVDRGHRELPIRADFIGKSIPTSKDEKVICDFTERQIIIK
jgi:pyrimidine operon attenuation protein/uracil phosphoribosyltransferase